MSLFFPSCPPLAPPLKPVRPIPVKPASLPGTAILLVVFLASLVAVASAINIGTLRDVLPFPVETGTGHENFYQDITVTTGLSSSNDAILSEGQSIGVFYEGDSTFSEQMSMYPSFMYQYYPNCLSGPYTAIGDMYNPASPHYIAEMETRLKAVFQSVDSIPASLALLNIPTLHCATYEDGFGQIYCNQGPWGQPENEPAPGTNLGSFPSDDSNCNQWNGQAFQYDLEGVEYLFTMGRCCIPAECATFQWYSYQAGVLTEASDIIPIVTNIEDGVNPPGLQTNDQNAYTGRWIAVDPSSSVFGELQATGKLILFGIENNIPYPLTGITALNSGSDFPIEGMFQPSVWNCMVDPVIASNGVLPPGPDILLYNICEELATSTLVQFPSWSPGTSIPEPSYLSDFPWCKTLASYIAPVSQVQPVVAHIMTIGTIGDLSGSDSIPYPVTFSYTLTNNHLILTGLNGTQGLIPNMTIPVSDIMAAGPKLLDIPSVGFSLYAPQDEGYFVYTLKLNGEARRRRSCYCFFLCAGFGGCNSGDVSGLNKLKNQVTQLADTVGDLSRGLSQYEHDTTSYLKQVSSQLVSYMTAQSTEDKALWSTVDSIEQSLSGLEEIEREMQAAAIEYAQTALDHSKANTLLIAQTRSQYGYRVAQLTIATAVLRETVALASIRSMQNGAMASSVNYCETAFPFDRTLYNLIYNGGYSTSQDFPSQGLKVVSNGLPFGVNPTLGPVTVFPGNVIGIDCFLTINNPDSLTSTWKVPVYDSSQDQDVANSGGTVDYPVPQPPLIKSTGLPGMFRFLSKIDVVYSDNQIAIDNEHCALTSSRLPYEHYYVDIETLCIYASMDPIGTFYSGSGHPLLVNVTDSISIQFFGPNGGVFVPIENPVTFSNYITNSTAPSYARSLSVANVRVAFFDASTVISTTSSCKNTRFAQHTPVPSVYRFGKISLSDGIDHLNPLHVTGSFSTLLGLGPDVTAAPWQQDIIDSFMSGSGIGTALLMTQSQGLILDKLDGINSSSLALSTALLQQALLSNSSIQNMLINLQNQSSLNSLLLSRANGVQSSLNSVSSLMDANSQITASLISKVFAVQNSLSAEASNRQGIQEASARLESNISSISLAIDSATRLYGQQSEVLQEKANATTAEAFRLALAISKDTFSDQSSACSGFADIGCMIATFVKYLLMMLAFCLIGYCIYLLVVYVIKARKEAASKKPSVVHPSVIQLSDVKVSGPGSD